MIDFFKYGFVRIGSSSPEMRVADVLFNTRKIIEVIDEAIRCNIQVLVFPELCISGYTCGDLFYQKVLLDSVQVALNAIREKTENSKIAVIVGAPLVNSGRLFNTAVFIANGIIQGVVPKTYLCNTNEYYEERWFSAESDRKSDFIRICGEKVPFGTDLLFKDPVYNSIIGIEICEDLWSVIPPSSYQALAGANLLVNLSASDEYLGKSEYRDNLIKNQSSRCLASYIYSSSGPGESSTDLVFAGRCLISENGIILNESEKFKFETQLIYADVDIHKLETERTKNNSFALGGQSREFREIEFNLTKINPESICRQISKNPFVPESKEKRTLNCREIFEIQSTALAKRLRHIGTKNVVIGISGGLDSTLALLVCLRAFKKNNLQLKGIHAVSMPGFGTTNRTRSNAEKLAELLNTSYKSIDISKSVRQHFEDIDHNPEMKNVVYENAQARERTQILMDYANRVNGIVIGTGDMSESALGWSTYNGDHMSMYGVNFGVPKTLVKYIIGWCAEEEFSGEISEVLNDIILTPISPELLPPDDKGDIQQKTEDLVGPYELHDFFLYYFIRCGYPPDKIMLFAKQAYKDEYNFEELKKWLKIFVQRFFAQQYKRSCVPDGVKVGTISLSPRGDWRMPSDAEAAVWIQQIDNCF